MSRFTTIILGVLLVVPNLSAQSLLATVPVADYPQAMALNPFTDRIYTIEESANQITEIDGATNSATTISLGTTSPSLNGAITVNPFTNTIYATDGVTIHLFVLDGATHTLKQASVGNAPVAVAVNPYTNKIYVANSSDNTVTVVDGSSLSTTTLNVGIEPWAIAIDLDRNKIYVADFASNTVSVIDGRTNAVTSVPVGLHPVAVAVNRNTGNVYVANRDAATVTVINGAVIGTVPAGSVPVAIGINATTNKIYVVDAGGFVVGVGNTPSGVTVIDGVTGLTIALPIGNSPDSLAVDQVRNLIYVANGNVNCLTIIDGKSNTSATIGSIGNGASDVAVDVLTDRVYVMKLYPSASEVAVFSGLSSRFPLPLLDQLTGPVNGIR
jgi:YVTN family beta-propeller protein